MLEGLKNKSYVVGVKQSAEAVREGKAILAYVAEDADFFVTEPFEELCKEHAVTIEKIATKKELGHACGIDVSAAVAVVLKG